MTRTIYTVVKVTGTELAGYQEETLRGFSSENSAKLHVGHLYNLKEKYVNAQSRLYDFKRAWVHQNENIDWSLEKQILFDIAYDTFVESSGIDMEDVGRYYEFNDADFEVQELEFEDEE